MRKKKIITIVGARPQIIKASAISRAIALFFTDQIDEVIVHTGQHYDHEMAGIFMQQFGMGMPDYSLEVGSGTHGAQTARILEKYEALLLEKRPAATIVIGDINSTVACALAASKIGVPVNPKS